MSYILTGGKINKIRKSLLFSIQKEVRAELQTELEQSANLLKKKRIREKLTEFKILILKDLLTKLKQISENDVSSKEMKSTFVKTSKKKKPINRVNREVSNLNETSEKPQ